MSSPACYRESQGQSESWSGVIATPVPVDVVKNTLRVGTDRYLYVLVSYETWILIGIFFAFYWMCRMTLVPLFCLWVKQYLSMMSCCLAPSEKRFLRKRIQVHSAWNLTVLGCIIPIVALHGYLWFTCRALIVRVWICIIFRSIIEASLLQLWGQTIN